MNLGLRDRLLRSASGLASLAVAACLWPWPHRIALFPLWFFGAIGLLQAAVGT